jgi:hypothetical protein
VGTGKKRGELALLTAVSPAIAKKPPNTAPVSLSEAARTLPLGVVGQLGMTGAHSSLVHDFAGWDLGSVWKK